MKITLHQVENLPWLGLLDKLSKSDEFVLLDTVQYEAHYFQNRNKIRTKDGWTYLTIPVESHNHKSLKEVLISPDNNWKKKYLNTIKQNYSKSPYFDKYYPYLEFIINKNYTHLIDYNKDLLYHFLEWFSIKKSFYYSSQLEIDTSLKSTDLLVEICSKLNANTYLSGISGRDYLDLEKFKEANIEVEFHNFFHPTYKQVYEPFIPGMSAIDLLFSYGDRAKEIIKGKGIGTIELILNKIDYKDKKILEMFGGDGSGELSAFSNNCSNLYIWELNRNNFNTLYENYKIANKFNANSLTELKKNVWYNYFDILIIDPPATMSMNLILPEALKLLKNEGIVIFRAIKKSYNNNPQVHPDLSLEEWNAIIHHSGYDILRGYEQPREYFFLDLWLNNFIYHLKRR
jgi:16S rRNA G966 N2-methylase RsmD